MRRSPQIKQAHMNKKRTLDVDAPLPTARRRVSAVSSHVAEPSNESDSMDYDESYPALDINAPLPSARSRHDAVMRSTSGADSVGGGSERIDIDAPLPSSRRGQSMKTTELRESKSVDGNQQQLHDEKAAKSTRELMLVHEYMDIDEYRRDSKQGRFKKYGRMSFSEKRELFGSPYPPIFVPLAQGESKEMYEARFLRWLKREHGMTLQELTDHPIQIRERFMRMRFATANAKGSEKFIPPPKKETTRDECALGDKIESTPSKIARRECSGRKTLRGRLTCGCKQCLVSGIQNLAEQISGVEHRLQQPTAIRSEAVPQPEIVDLTQERIEEPSCQDHDLLEHQLVDRYNMVNEQIVMNERVLDASMKQLVSNPIVDIQATTQLQDENQEMYELIEGEFASRNASLAMLIVWIWRDQIVELEKMIDAKNAGNVPHIQLRCHQRCADIAARIANAIALPTTRKQGPVDSNNAFRISELISMRKELFQTLLHFDAQLRQLRSRGASVVARIEDRASRPVIFSVVDPNISSSVSFTSYPQSRFENESALWDFTKHVKVFHLLHPAIKTNQSVCAFAATSDESSQIVPMTVASAWSFLDPHFRALRGLLVVEDEPRLDSDGKVGFGRDSETDWWIGIKWFDLVTNNLKTRNRIVVLRRVREALLLTSLLAHIDNSLWIQKLRKLSGFELAPFMEITNQQLRPNFQLLVAGTGVSTWELTVQYLCGIENYSETFIQDMERAVQLAGGIYEYSWRPHLQLHGRVFHVDPQFGQFDLEAMNGIDSVILNLQAATNQASRSSCPSFLLSSLVLNMEALSQDSDAIEILRRIIEYGITVESIRLPDGSGVGGDWESPAWREAWIRLVCSLCCLPSTPASSSTKVKKITISADLVYRADFLLLCSALLHARSVQYLAIEGRHDEPNPVQASFPPSVWHLLCLALIPRDSTTSIESLSVRGISINTENVDEVFDMTAQWFPLNAYYIDWVPGGQTAAPSHDDPTVVNIPVGTLVQGHYGILDEPYSVVTDSLLQGIVVDEDENSVHVLIFGRGFCSIARSALPEERIILPRIRDVDEESTSLLKSIELTTTPDDTTSEEELIEFVTYGAGRAAQSLRLQIPNLGEEHVHAIFEMCPNLQHLAIGSVALPSMNVFQTAIDTGVPLRYLELNDVVVPNDSLKEFLWRYCGQEDGPSTPTLPNLRLGPVSDEILEELESLIAQPYGLRHLEYTIVLPDQRLFERLAKRNHGRSTGLISQALPNNVKLAFLGCMARLRRLSPQLDVTDEIKSLICTYAATPQTRTVVCSSAPFRQ